MKEGLITGFLVVIFIIGVTGIGIALYHGFYTCLGKELYLYNGYNVCNK